ncbi:MAG: penicillin-binding protein 2 [Candidatus Promineifilaceae bacterium]|nr:penicillin-binding protein 2 [Candidatus Promineifilaceae bacterium]
MNSSQQRRLWMVIVGIGFATVIIVGRLVAFQIVQGEHWKQVGEEVRRVTVVAQPNRGIIYDANGAILAGNSADYQIGASPRLISSAKAEEMATALAPILQESRMELLAQLDSDQTYVLLASRVAPAVADAIRSLPFEDNVQIDPLPRRIYPQEQLMCHILGYVDFDGNGGAGVEGYYQSELAGEAATDVRSISPLTPQRSVIAREGADLVLTIDRTVQYAVEQHLERAVREHGARSGTIIVMDPRTGAILALANTPCYAPYKFYETERSLLVNPAISRQYEPGSVMKLVTMAAALDSGAVTPASTYFDSGVLELGGHRTYNWDRSGPGTVDMTTLLARSLNVGAATIATWVGPEQFYTYLERFNFGRPTGIDLMSEAGGTMHLPGSAYWTESFIATNAYGQGIAVTPLQMIASVAALANGGRLMQPHVVQEIRANDQVYEYQPNIIAQPVAEETARQLSAMAVSAVQREVNSAQVEGYTIAGKTGTAEIPENGVYLSDATIGSFIGWLPADDPQMVILVKLDRTTSSPWGSVTAAPTFASLVEELVVMLNIAPDAVRLQAAQPAAEGVLQPQGN